MKKTFHIKILNKYKININIYPCFAFDTHCTHSYMISICHYWQWIYKASVIKRVNARDMDASTITENLICLQEYTRFSKVSALI